MAVEKKLILAPSWHVWSYLRELMNSFYNDDLLQRILILWIMAVLIVYGNNAPLVDEEISAMRSTVGAYMVARMSANLAHLEEQRFVVFLAKTTAGETVAIWALSGARSTRRRPMREEACAAA